MASRLVIGVGNDYRGDDAVGLHVARLLRAEGLGGVVVREMQGDGTSLVEIWQGAETVVLADAVVSGAEPGFVHRFDARARSLPAHVFSPSSTHAFGVAEGVELARQLNRLPERLIVYGIEGKDFRAGALMTPEVEKAAAGVVEYILEDLR